MAAKKSTAVEPAKSLSRKTSSRKAAKGRRNESAGEQPGDAIVPIDRRRESRRAEESQAEPPAPALERRKKVQRRRQIDPTTCERDYSVEEVEFMNAMDEYKRKSGRMFPTCSEVLEVVRSLGYVKLSPAGQAILASNDELNSGEDPAIEEEQAVEAAF